MRRGQAPSVECGVWGEAGPIERHGDVGGGQPAARCSVNVDMAKGRNKERKSKDGLKGGQS